MKPNGKNGRKKSVAKRKPNGKYLPGTEGGPGRPKTSLNWMTRFGEWAATHKMTPEQAALKLIEKLWTMGVDDGDMNALRLLAERVFGAMDRSPLIAVQVNATGPPLPDLDRMAEHLLKAVKVAEDFKRGDEECQP